MASYPSNVTPLRGAARSRLGAKTDAEEKLVKDCVTRLERAERDRSKHRSRIADCYKFALTWRHTFDSNVPGSLSDEVFDSTATTVLEDFSADILNTFTPMKSQWAEIKPALRLDVGDTRRIQDDLLRYNEVLFSEIRRSNFYQAAQECYLDLGIGTMAMSINDVNIAEPIHCQAIPQTELLLDKGMYGRNDGIWRKWPKMRGEEIGIQWPKAKAFEAPDNSLQPGDVTEHDVIDGIYRDWSTPAVEKWKYVVLIGDRAIFEESYQGQGSNGLIVARWSRDSTTAWGVGPTYQVLPSIKVLNYIQERELKALDKAVDPVTSYEDDSVINLALGIEGGVWLPRAVGSKAPEVIESQANFQVSFAKREDLVHEIKRAHYQDRPEHARRMGTPATNLVHEWQYAIINRFAYLLEKRGVLPKVAINGAQVAIEPVSPLLRAQEQEEVVRIQRWLEMIAATYGPQMMPVLTKPNEVSAQLAEKLGVPVNLSNSPEEITAAMQQFAPVIQQITAGNPVAQQAPAPV
jgi:hypothetical protein